MNILVLLPFLALAAVLDAVVCVSAAYTGIMLVLMLIVWFIVFYIAWLLVFLLLLAVASLPVNKSELQKTRAPFYSALAKYALGLMTALLRVRIDLQGEELIPEGRWLLVCNHRSGFDPVLTIWALRHHDLAFVAKPSILSIPVIGRFAHKIGCLAINRDDDRQALKTILAAAELIKTDVTSLAIYPEGTRNTEETLLPFRNGAFKIAQKAKVPIVVMTVENTENIRKRTPWRSTRVTLRIHEVISADRVCELKTSEIGEEVWQHMEKALA
jgi:1-acyl-sn-glycerol-3-phosphate acyltransferase